MSVNSEFSDSEQKLTISISGNFDFSIQKAFRDAYQDTDADASYVVNLMETEYMDSSALGMLLMLRKHAGDERSNVSLFGANQSVRKILDVAKFDRLFDIR